MGTGVGAEVSDFFTMNPNLKYCFCLVGRGQGGLE